LGYGYPNTWANAFTGLGKRADLQCAKGEAPYGSPALPAFLPMNKPTLTAPAYAITMASAADVELRLTGPISWWRNGGAEFTARVTEMIGKGAKNVTVYLNSGGGEVLEANEIVNQINRFSGKKTIRVGALCASAATLVLLAVPKENRYGAKNGMYMTHPPTLRAEGNAAELRKAADALEKFTEQIRQTYVDECGMSEADATALLTGENWLTAAEAKAKGFLGHVDNTAKITKEDKAAALNVLNSLPNVPRGLLVTAGLVAEDDQTFYEQPTPREMILNTVLAAALGVALSATEDQIEAAIKRLSDERETLAGEVKALKTKLAETEGLVAKDRATALVEDAFKAKKITAAEKDQWQADAEANYELTARMISKLKGVTNLTAGLEDEEDPERGDTPGVKAGREKWTYEDYLKNKALDELVVNKALHDKLFLAHYGFPATAPSK
jgi:ATP-dependent protease ClpP protease subunit